MTLLGIVDAVFLLLNELIVQLFINSGYTLSCSDMIRFGSVQAIPHIGSSNLPPLAYSGHRTQTLIEYLVIIF